MPDHFVFISGWGARVPDHYVFISGWGDWVPDHYVFIAVGETGCLSTMVFDEVVFLSIWFTSLFPRGGGQSCGASLWRVCYQRTVWKLVALRAAAL